MPEHDAGVAAVLVKGFAAEYGFGTPDVDIRAAQTVLRILAAAGYAVVRVPDGVAVEHGARLETIGWVGVAPDDEPGEWFFHYDDEDDHGHTEVRPAFTIEQGEGSTDA